MHKNPLWLGALCLLGIITFWYSADAVWKLWQHEAMYAVAEASNVSFSIADGSSDKFYLKGSYTFAVDANQFEGETTLHHPVFRNYIAAQEMIPENEKKEWKILYNPDNPNYSTLEKQFPFKECLYAGMLWILLFYFLWIGWRVNYGNSHS